MDDDGRVEVPPVMYAAGQRAAAVAQRNKDVAAADRIAEEIRAAVRKATDADQNAAAALRAATKAAATAGTAPMAAGVSPAEAATLVRRAASGDRKALEKLKDFKHLFADPYFAHELMQSVGAERLTELPGQMSKHLADVLTSQAGGDPEQIVADNNALLGMLSDALATSTNDNSPFYMGDDFLERLQEEGRSSEHALSGGNRFSGYWGLGQIMNAADAHPPYATNFLDEVGNDMVAWDQQRQSHGVAGPYGPYSGGGPFGAFNQPGSPLEQAGTQADPLSGLLHAASTNGDGAQELLLGNAPDDPNMPTRFDDQSNLDYLLSGRPEWGDGGNDLGEAIEAAASAKDPDDPGVAHRAAQVAVETVNILGRDIEDDFGQVHGRLSAMEDSIGRMLGGRIDDVNTSVNGDDIEIANGPAARFGHQDLAHVLKYATKDNDGFDALVRAQLGHMKTDINDAAERGDVPDLKEAARQGSRGLGAIVEARLDGLSDDAKANDQAYGLLARAAKTGVGPVPVPGSAVAAEAANAMFKHLGPNAIADVRATEASYDRQANQIIRDMLSQAVVEHHLYGQGETPQVWLNDPSQKGRATFVDAGKVMDWDELKTTRPPMARSTRGPRTSIAFPPASGRGETVTRGAATGTPTRSTPNRA